MSLLKNLFSAKTPPDAGPETAPVKMNLEERMAFRREMLYEAIKVTMKACGMASSAYKFRVVRNDKRGHQYSIMIDLSQDFMLNPETQQERLVAVGHAITHNAMSRYGVVVQGVYWRINEELPASQRAALVESAPTAPDALSAREKYEQATADELAAFEAAWQKGQELRVGDRLYSSDLAPLEGDSGGQGESRN